jgi:hypothetical protein
MSPILANNIIRKGFCWNAGSWYANAYTKGEAVAMMPENVIKDCKSITKTLEVTTARCRVQLKDKYSVHRKHC